MRERPRDFEGVEFTGMSEVLTRSAAFRSLDGTSLMIYLGLCLEHNGANNGVLNFCTTDAMKSGMCSKPMAMKCMRNLIDRGLIIRTYMGRRITTEQRLKSQFEITDYPMLDDDGWRHGCRIFVDWNGKDPVDAKASKARTKASQKRAIRAIKDSKRNPKVFREAAEFTARNGAKHELVDDDLPV